MKKRSVLPNPVQVGTSNPTVQQRAPQRELPPLSTDPHVGPHLQDPPSCVELTGVFLGEWAGGRRRVMSYFALVTITIRPPFPGGEISSGHRLHAKAPGCVAVLCESSMELTPLCEPAVTECSRSWLHLTLDLSNQSSLCKLVLLPPASCRSVLGSPLGTTLPALLFLHPHSSLFSGCPASPPNGPLSFLVTLGSLHN